MRRLETMEWVIVAAIAMIVGMLVMVQIHRDDMMDACLNDDRPEYECYGLIYGGRR